MAFVGNFLPESASNVLREKNSVEDSLRVDALTQHDTRAEVVWRREKRQTTTTTMMLLQVLRDLTSGLQKTTLQQLQQQQ